MPLVFLLSIGCTSSSSIDSGTDTPIINDTAAVEEGSFDELFVIPERPFDMSFSQEGTLYISADASGKLYRWDGSELKEENGSYEDIQAIYLEGTQLYHTTTDNGVTGILYRDGEELIRQSTEGTLLRWPVDIIALPSQEIVIADYNAGLLFTYQNDGTSLTYTGGSQTPQALAFRDGSLYIGGEDGIWKKDWPNGTAEQIDTRAANGLAFHNDILYASSAQNGIFVVGGGSYSLPETIGRPSTLVVHQNMLYLIDQIGRGIWTMDL